MALSAPTDLIDIGLNLTHDSFDTDRDSVLARAAEQGVHRMIVTGSDIAHSRRALELVADVPARLRSTAGVHPHHASQFAAHDRNELMALVHDPGVVAVGECGLDYFRNFSSHEDQERVFRMQLEIATSVNKPVFLHQRDAHEPFTAILRDYIGALSAGGVAHCFTAGRAEAGAYLDMGLYIGITGWICDERRGMHLREVARYIPQDRLLIETDAPYLLPRDLTPKPASRRNEPCYLPRVLQTLAHCRSDNAAELGRATTENAERLFGWRG